MKRILVFLFIFGLSTSLIMGGESATGGAFLDNSIDPSIVSMGGINNSIGHNTSGLFHNPALLAMSEETELQLSTHQSFETTYYSAGYSLSFYGIGIGLGYKSAQTPGALITQYDPDLGKYIDSGNRFSYEAKTISLGLACSPIRDFLLGVSVKQSSEALYTMKGQGIGVDAGLLFDLPEQGFTFGLSAQNILSPKLENFSKYPLTVSAGVSKIVFDYYLINVDVQKKESGPTTFHGGLEFKFHPILPFSVGYNNGALSAGVRLELKTVQLSYAIQFPKQGETFLDNAHYFALTVRL